MEQRDALFSCFCSMQILNSFWQLCTVGQDPSKESMLCRVILLRHCPEMYLGILQPARSSYSTIHLPGPKEQLPAPHVPSLSRLYLIHCYSLEQMYKVGRAVSSIFLPIAGEHQVGAPVLVVAEGCNRPPEPSPLYLFDLPCLVQLWYE